MGHEQIELVFAMDSLGADDAANRLIGALHLLDKSVTLCKEPYASPGCHRQDCDGWKAVLQDWHGWFIDSVLDHACVSTEVSDRQHGRTEQQFAQTTLGWLAASMRDAGLALREAMI